MKDVKAISFALADIYTGVAWIDLEKDSFEAIKAPDVIKKLLRNKTSAQDAINFVMQSTVHGDELDKILSFVELKTLPQRMKKEKYVNTEYYGEFSGWVRGSFIEVARDDEGNLIQVLYVYQAVNEEKQMELACQEEEKRKFHEQTEKLDLERQYLNVLTQDYVLVYDVDLLEDRAEVVQIRPHSHVYRMSGMEPGASFIYSEHIQEFAEKYVVNNKNEYLKKLSIPYILQQMNRGSRYSFRFDSIRNAAGNKHYEVEVVRANPHAFDGRVLVVSHEIDDIVEMERKYQEELEIEREYLDLLTQDFIAAYHVNLRENTSTLIKVDRKLEQYGSAQSALRCKNNYIEKINLYGNKFVVPNLKEEFQLIMSLENIKSRLKNRFRIIYRYRTIQQNGHQFYEAQIFRMDDTVENVLIGFRSIDDIVTAEQKHQIELEERYEKEKNQNEVLVALGRGYQAIFRIDLQKDTYEKIACDDFLITFYDVNESSASRVLENLCDTVIDERFVDRMRNFFDLKTLATRLRDTDSIEMECIVKDGNWHRARFIVKRRDDAGEVISVLYVTQMIDDEKRYQERLLSRVESADLANRAKTEFISQVAHDIRTPMNAMLGFLEIAKADPTDKETVTYALDKMYQAGIFLKELISDVLDVSKMETKKIELQSVQVNLKEFFGEIYDAMMHDSIKSKYTIRFDTNFIYDCVIADPLRLKQIYSNILSNAVKYTPKGGTIELKAFTEKLPDEDLVRLVVEIRDTGIGMSSEFMKKMFDEYERAVDTRINKVSGYGLGLSIVKHLVNAMGGSIHVSSQVGEGSTFTISLDVPYVKNVVVEEKEVHEIDYEKICKGMHLLVAEDNELNREVVTELLKIHGITCEQAENGYVCLEKIKMGKDGDYDAILMDMQMPIMNGVEATKQIRALSLTWTKQIPIIAMTANTMKEDIQNCINAGMNGHLSKPINMEEMMRLLAKIKLHEFVREREPIDF